MNLVIECITKKYATFSGRAQRKEYWLFALFIMLLSLIAAGIDFGTGTFDDELGMGAVGAIVALATFIPGFSVVVRRLHDTDRVGWWLLIVLIPLIGVIWWIVLMCLKGTDGENRFGPDPLTPTSSGF